jgi:hypothetical protein
MAAQERAKQTQGITPAAIDAPAAVATEDLLFHSTTTTTAAAPSQDLFLDTTSSPPPPFDDALFAPPPPPFDASQLPPAMSVFDPMSTSFDPNLTATYHVPTPSAPPLEDLLPTLVWDPHAAPEIMAPEPSAPVDAAAILGLAMSPEESRALMEEQQKIWASLQKSNQQPTTASSAADAFESRSLASNVASMNNATNTTTMNTGTNVMVSGVPSDAAIEASSAQQPQRPRQVDLGNGQSLPLHGPDRTHAAIALGTAVSVQCLACDTWMQVTPEATLMYCPVCATVSAVQMDNSDLELAERLQREEYEAAERAEARVRQRDEKKKQGSTSSSTSTSEQGWLEWLGVTGSTTPASTVSQPRPASSTSSPHQLIAAQTDTISFEQESLIPRRGARVAQSQPLFSCVAESITSAVSSAINAASRDEEGNVHGVDASGLLAMPKVGERDSGNEYNRL